MSKEKETKQDKEKKLSKIDGWYLWIWFLLIGLYSFIFQIKYMIMDKEFVKGMCFFILIFFSSYLGEKVNEKWRLFK